MAKSTCSVVGCDRPAECRGFCSPHYKRWWRYGSVGSNPVGGLTTADRFMAKVEKAPSGCWIWTATINQYGYGEFNWIAPDETKRRMHGAHRVAYVLFVGPIPSGLDLDHLCRVRACVNPQHLEPVTRRVNLLRSPFTPTSLNAAKTHCKYGHEFTPENTYVDKHGHRTCRTCHRVKERERKARTA